MTTLSGRRHVSLLYLLVLLQCVNVCVVAIARTHGQFYFPETPPQQKLEPVIQQLKELGFSQYQAADNQASWDKLSTENASFDLVWSVTASPPFAQLELPHQFDAKVNHLPGAEQLTSPDALSQHLALQQRKHAKFFFDFMPAHYELPRDLAQLTKAYTDVRKKSDMSPKRGYDPNVHRRFLLRERAVNGDDDLTTHAEVFVTDADLQSKLQSSAFKGKTVVVDQFVEPLLLDNHKFRVGFYVVVTSIDPLRVYVYNHPLIQIAKAEYPRRLEVETDPAAYNFDQYISPWDFPDLQTCFQELPSATREGTNAWYILKRYLRRQGIDTKHLQDNVDATIAKVVLSNRGNFKSEQAKVKRAGEGEGRHPSDLSDNFFEMWKVNFEFDSGGKPWLLRVVSNPLMEATQSVLATDEAIKKQLLYDLINLVGVHPQARLPFERFFLPADAIFCSDKCHDKNRAWDPTCWSCPGWFAPNVARKLFAASMEYARRGSFNLVFPSLEQKLSKFLDTELSEYDIAFDRYLKSLSSGYSNLEDFPASERTVECVYREHCSDHGNCVNGMCSCDNNYEGRTCYIPKDFEQEEEPDQQESEDAGAQIVETWKEKAENFVLNRSDATTDLKRPLAGVGDASVSTTLLLLVLLGVLLFVVCRVFRSRWSSANDGLPHDGKFM
ncbi:unnamed protein product [Peronospora farinosa]|uniref:Tubulin--tyrosine ligase-like protein 5 n=1 Tax=Peronospora farinosa TaxID=134698 RepID=A0AAV0ST00_9STRA|nr:unnamed protein product [Peronospora farinosa]CAI5706355.1 unnamed protein product [Peronospora farinosa]